jgi:SAM-dependent methyltransferase
LNKNISYAKKFPALIFPPDYYLYETYKLDYQQYIEDGDLSAKEIIEWTTKYLPHQQINLLEWGCGVGRTTRHLKNYLPASSNVFACDINEEMVCWNKKNINNITFSQINHRPPTEYSSLAFNVVFAISVFTHIDSKQQEKWVKEIHRILDVNGVFLFTTHGSYYYNKLLPKEREELNAKGTFTKRFNKNGHRLMSTYNHSDEFKIILENIFEIVEFYEGSKYFEKVGGQDLWIVKKR